MKPIERPCAPFKKRYYGLLNSPSFKRSACSYVTIIGDFERFQYLNFETRFLEIQNFSFKTGIPFFS